MASKTKSKESALKKQRPKKTGNSRKLAKEEGAGSLKSKKPKLNSSTLKADIKSKPKTSEMPDYEERILEERALAKEYLLSLNDRKKRGIIKQGVQTGIPGFDKLFEKRIPKGSVLLVAGGAGSGKTIFCLQTLAYHASQGEKCLYMSFEESEAKLMNHMKDFGWDVDNLINSGNLRVKKYSSFEIARSVDALLAKEKGELLIDFDPMLLPEGFKPDFIALDSLTALAATFTEKEDSYRIYIEQLFNFFEKLGATSFLITETKQMPEIFSTTGVEEFLADGLIVLYNIERGNIRERAIEVLKMRGAKHQERIVAMEITDNGLVVYPEQQVFDELGEK